jgi:hypothetical protein
MGTISEVVKPSPINGRASATTSKPEVNAVELLKTEKFCETRSRKGTRKFEDRIGYFELTDSKSTKGDRLF